MPRSDIVALYAKLAAHIADGILRVPVQATFPIDDIRQAVALSNAYRRAGKVLMTPNGAIR